MTTSENECREAFEKWITNEDEEGSAFFGFLSLGKNSYGRYADEETYGAWLAYKAAWNARSQDAEDARRYRWLRNTTDGSVEHAVIERLSEKSWLLCGKGLDEAIDAAMSK